MNKQIRLTNPILKIVNRSLMDLPTPINISFIWNFGSLLGLFLLIQIVTGLFLSIHYRANVIIAFDSIIHICRDVNYGWLIRVIHANGASFVFICLYIHIGRGIYFNSFKLKKTWIIGIILIFLMIITAFIGYVLPWGQISFWGATVITNLLSAIPYLGLSIVQWIWGGFAVDNATLSRFYTFHFILPFIVLIFTIIHLIILHESGSNNPIGLNRNLDKVYFHPYFSYKDLVGFFIFLLMLSNLLLSYPYLLSDPDNFIPANPLVTPIHIQPEWYFLFAYAILRSIPNKLGGVIALLISLLILFFIPLLNHNKFQSSRFYPFNKFIFWILVIFIILLTWIGARPVEDPYIVTGQIITVLYFNYFFINQFISDFWESKILIYKK